MSGAPHRSADPVVRFLGPRANRNGPFGVLGLPVADHPDESIVQAVHERMAAIDAHPESRTPAADEARLAVHAAAANLLDPGVRAALLEQLGVARDAPRPSRAAPPEGDRARLRLEADLLRSIGAAGGWGPAARDRFMKLAHARGYDAAEAVASIRGLAGSIGTFSKASDLADPVAARPFAARRPVARPSFAASSPQRTDTGPTLMRVADDDPVKTDSLMTTVLIVCSTVVLMVLIGGVVLLLVGSEPATPALNTPPPSAPIARTPGNGRAPTDEAAPERPSRALDNAPAVLHELEVAAEGTGVDPEAALDGFALAVDSLASRWGRFGEADRLAAQDLIVGFMYRVSGRRASLGRAFGALASGLSALEGSDPPGADGVWRAAWSMGTLVRLRREQNLPGSLLRDIDGAVLASSGRIAPNASTFRAGAIAALRALADPLNESGLTRGEADAWEAWVEAVNASAIGDRDLVDSMLIAALDGRLRHGERSAPNDAGVIAVLAGAMEWGEGAAARAWLVRAFDDRSLGIDELHAVTLALANTSTAGGVNHSLVLPRGAGDYDRRALRDRYRELWGIAEDADQGQTLADWAETARAFIGRGATQNANGQVRTMGAIVRTARLNTAAAMLWRAEVVPASDLLTDLDPPVDAVVSATGGGGDAGSLFAVSGGTWAEAYLSAGSHVQKRLDLLAVALGRSGRLGAMEAEVIVQEALRGSPLKIREEAGSIVGSQLGSPTVVNAVLEALPLMPKTDRNAALVERIAQATLPSIDSPDFDLEARRAVVERLLEMVAGQGDYARLDALSGLLDNAYADRVATPGSSVGASASAAPAMDAREAARTLASRWIASAERRPPAPVEGVTIEEILGRRAARLSAAEGLVQVFHAEQMALVEAMAQVIAGEGTGRAPAVREVLEDLRRERARSRHVLAQIEHAERAMLRLWLIRFSEGAG